MTLKPFATLATLAVLAGSPVLAQDGPKNDAPQTEKKTDKKTDKNAALQERINGLIADLADPTYEVREKAYKALVKIGQPAVPALQKAKESKDAEVAASAAEALRAIGKSSPQPERGTQERPRDPRAQPRRGQIPGMPNTDDEFFNELEKGLPKTMQDLMKRMREQGNGNGGFRMLTPDDPIFKEFMKGLGGKGMDLEQMFGIKPGQPRARSRTFTWSNVPQRQTPANRLGVVAGQPSRILRSHLDLPAHGGLVINRFIGVRPWAQQQGLQPFDIMLSIDGKPLRAYADFNHVLAGGKLEIVRKGKRMTLTLAKAPEPEQPQARPRPVRPAPKAEETPATPKKESRDF